jgi:hypothetical protein
VLRESREFATAVDYEAFVQQTVAERGMASSANAGRAGRDPTPNSDVVEGRFLCEQRCERALDLGLHLSLRGRGR